jgi:uncharacterized protein YjiS (DUF1127 family)
MPARTAVQGWPALPQPARHLWASAAQAIASFIVRRAASQAHRELAALDDRMLADIGVGRAELKPLLDALAEARTAAVLAQFPWNHPRMSA